MKDLGVTKDQVMELRFLCTEIFNSDYTMLHFKSGNADVIETAFSGDQSRLKTNSWKQSHIPLSKPVELEKFVNKFDKNRFKEIDTVNSSKTGGLLMSPFGASSIGSFWTIQGEDPKVQVYECGNYHRDPMKNSGVNSPAMAKTTHKIFFRGKPSTDEEVRERLKSKIKKEAK